jgi:hypothetical protein
MTMKIRDDSLPEWTFRVDEVSAGVFEVTGRASDGRSVSLKGTDPDALIARCKDQARELEAR